MIPLNLIPKGVLLASRRHQMKTTAVAAAVARHLRKMKRSKCLQMNFGALLYKNVFASNK